MILPTIWSCRDEPRSPTGKRVPEIKPKLGLAATVVCPAAGRAIVTGPFTHNFDAVVKEFLSRDALIQTSEVPQDFQNPERLYEAFVDLLEHPQKRLELGEKARAVMHANRGATAKTLEYLSPLLRIHKNQ